MRCEGYQIRRQVFRGSPVRQGGPLLGARSEVVGWSEVRGLRLKGRDPRSEARGSRPKPALLRLGLDRLLLRGRRLRRSS